MKLSDLPIGSKIKFGRYQVKDEDPEVITWIIIDQNHKRFPKDSTTLYSEYILDRRSFDDDKYNGLIEPENPSSDDRDDFGNNDYYLSNIRQWMNSDASYGQWYHPTYEFDNPPYYKERPGFLYHFSLQEKKLILNTNIIYFKNDLLLEDAYDIPTITSPYFITDKIFLLSAHEICQFNLTQISFEDDGNSIGFIGDGDIFDFLYFADQRICNSSPQYERIILESEDENNNEDPYFSKYYLRTPTYYHHIFTGVSQIDAYMGTPVPWQESRANNKEGFRPALNLKSTVEVSENPDENGYYSIILPELSVASKFKKIALEEDNNLLFKKIQLID